VTVVVIATVIVIMIAPATGEPLRELRIRFDQKLRRAFRPNEDRVRVEPDIRVGLNVEGHPLDAEDRLEMRRAGRVRAADQSVVGVEERAAGAVGDVRRRDRNVGAASPDVARRIAAVKVVVKVSRVEPSSSRRLFMSLRWIC